MLIPLVCDCHVHLRRGEELRRVISHTAERCCRAIVMPPNRPPIVADARSYAEYVDDVLDACRPYDRFSPLFTFEVAGGMTARGVRAIAAEGAFAAKIYLSRISDLDALLPALRAVIDSGMLLCIHRANDGHDGLSVISSLVELFPVERMVLEHVSTISEVRFCIDVGLHGTVTAHHLILVRGDCDDPELFCHPVAGNEFDRITMQMVASSGNDLFMFGSDSAPHPGDAKAASPPAAGVFTSPVALEILRFVLGAVEGGERMLPWFTSGAACRFHGWPMMDGEVDVSDAISDPKLRAAAEMAVAGLLSRRDA